MLILASLMELVVNPIFCNEIFGVIKTLKFLPRHTLKMLLPFKIWPRCVVLNSIQFHKHFGTDQNGFFTASEF